MTVFAYGYGKIHAEASATMDLWTSRKRYIDQFFSVVDLPPNLRDR
ncbi:MAG TPA: hypothetical protein VNF68_14615 [Candidatus Baltobacteraceae bacterium]|nr:hypothetical protein [Candidatus Baltobacteraceae bacterium]